MPTWSSGPQRVCYIVLGAILVAAAGIGLRRPLILNADVPIETTRVARLEQRIDPNTAPWSELARLPGIGETLAKRIVAYRHQARAEPDPAGGTEPVFRCLDDLDAVRGIGPKTLSRIANEVKLPGDRGDAPPRSPAPRPRSSGPR